MTFRNKRLKKSSSPLKGFRGLFFITLNLFFIYSNAQWQQPCQDTLRKNTYFQCNEQLYAPVCGCTNKTYRNQCVSYNVFGVNIIKSNGVCQEQQFDFDFYPNPAKETINFALEFFDQGNMTLQIFDTYGKLMFFSHKASLHRFDDVISIAGYRPGLYIVTVISGSKYQAKKLIVR